jgi:hypothetical protein
MALSFQNNEREKRRLTQFIPKVAALGPFSNGDGLTVAIEMATHNVRQPALAPPQTKKAASHCRKTASPAGRAALPARFFLVAKRLAGRGVDRTSFQFLVGNKSRSI